MENNLYIAFALTLGAGLATAIGSAIAFMASRTNFRFLSVTTGFSAGVMLYVSFMEILPKGALALSKAHGDSVGNWLNIGSFFAGILLSAIIDQIIPAAENPHEMHSEAETRPLHEWGSAPHLGVSSDKAHHRKLLRMGIFTAVAISIHNFPEGMATFLAALEDPKVGAAIAIAIALHNIPEGISVSVPIFYATGDRLRACIYSVLSGLAEPLGAALGYIALVLLFGGDHGAIPSSVMGVLFGAVAGIMVYVSLDELLPASRAYGKAHDSLLGVVGGMAVMATSLLLMK
ncbi:MAG: zinc transporter ZupT [Proteobacteria bacterium]|nr:zinc transporter ZupT [Pseudomonadota bacterium]